MSTPLTVLVSGATGNQGGAVARALIAKGHKVRALTRNTTSPSAKQLEALGAELVQSDLDNPESIGQVLKGVDSFYFELGKKDNKQLKFLETPQQQINLFAQMGVGNEDVFYQTPTFFCQALL